jgi:hypothetical protein
MKNEITDMKRLFIEMRGSPLGIYISSNTRSTNSRKE